MPRIVTLLRSQKLKILPSTSFPVKSSIHSGKSRNNSHRALNFRSCSILLCTDLGIEFFFFAMSPVMTKWLAKAIVTGFSVLRGQW